MRHQLATTVATYCLLALAGGFSFVLPDQLGVQHLKAMPGGTPDVIKLSGTIRDFKKTNADFKTAPSGGNGHYAGNVNFQLGSDDRPVFSGNGSKISTQWRDKNFNPLAPHLEWDLAGGSGVIPLSIATPSPKHGTVDTYNSAVGVYGGANVGPAPTYLVGAAMPAVSIPRSLSNLTNQGTVTYSGTSSISSDIHCDNFNGSGTINISGNVSILCNTGFHLSTHTIINLNGGARLRLYLRNGGSSWNHVQLNANTKNPQRVTVYNLGTATWVIHNHADIYANIVSPNGNMELSNHGTLYGTFRGRTIEYDNHGDFHVDTTPPRDMCDVVIADTNGSRGVSSTGGIASAAHFVTWFKDTLGTNLSMQHSIDLTHSGSGIYEYLDDSFHPVDNILFGNEGESHNNYFTYTIHVPFVHHACGGRFFEFHGCDDAWLFVDGMLAMDLGGIIPGTRQYVDMDRLGLVDDRSYTLHFFYAQRQSNFGIFRLRTNLDLQVTPQVYTITSVGD
jgi:fibro-slime domain-containing protein